MKKQYLYGAAAVAALALASCSQEELVSMQQDGIAYSVFTKNQTRTVDSYCEQNKPGAFNVWAQIADADGKLYIEGDQITNSDPNGNGSWIDATGTRYWPQDKNLNFFAEVNGENEFDYNGGAPKFNNFKVKQNVKDQLDLMYSVNMGAVNNGSPVALNFRHALSQVCFRATNNTKNLNVTINSVSVGHLTDGGTYTFPLATTDGPIVDPGHDDVYNDPTPDRNRGSWAPDDNYKNEYTADVNGGKVVIKSDDTEKTANLTCPGANHANGWKNVMTLMPQTVKAWNPEVKSTDNTYNGAYFLLDVVLNDDGSNGIQIYQGKIAIPVKIDWKEGYRYIYTFIFNEGSNGGWTPNPNDPKPVLTGISYVMTVDDFIPANADDPNGTDMNATETEEPTQPEQPEDPEYKLNLSIVKGEGDVENALFTFTELPASVDMSHYSVTVPEGYDFLGWTRTENGTEAEYLPEATIPFDNLDEGENNISVYAVIKKYYTYSLIFLPVNMSDENVDLETLPQAITEKSYDESFEFTIPPSSPLCGEYSFKGWAEKADWTKNTPRFNAGQKISATKDDPVKKLYTVWGVHDEVNPGANSGVEFEEKP